MIWITLHLALIAGLAAILVPHQNRIVLLAGLSLRLISGILVGFLYLHVLHSGDTFTFHVEAAKLYDLSQTSFEKYWEYLTTRHFNMYKGEARTELFTKITSIFYFFSNGNYWVASLYFSFISFLGALYFVLQFTRYYPQYRTLVFFAFLYLPSVAFWSSGVLKDTLINGSFFFLAGVIIKYYFQSRFSWREYLLTLLSLLLLFYLKHYLLVVSFLSMGSLIWFVNVLPRIQSLPLKWIASTILLLALVVAVSYVSPVFHLGQLPQTVFQNYQTIVKNSDSSVLTLTIGPNWSSLLGAAPKSFLAGCIRPFFWDVPFYYYPFAAESSLSLILILLNIRYWRLISPNILAGITLGAIILLATFLPLVSPNMGSLVRYRAAYLPFLVLLLAITPYKQLIVNRILSK